MNLQQQLENTVDVFERVPKLISPQGHRWIDIAAAVAFAIVGGVFLGRGNRRAATAAFIDSGLVAGLSSLTDYDGDGKKPISFKMHGFLDMVTATAASTEPPIFRFTGEGGAAFFYSGTPAVFAVVAMTDWNALEREAGRRAA